MKRLILLTIAYWFFIISGVTCIVRRILSLQVLHYAQELYEGMKAYLGVDGRIRLFRPMNNMQRMNVTAERACLPTFDGSQLLQCIKKYASRFKDLFLIDLPIAKPRIVRSVEIYLQSVKAMHCISLHSLLCQSINR